MPAPWATAEGALDPRAYASAAVGQENTERLLAHLAAWLDV